VESGLRKNGLLQLKSLKVSSLILSSIKTEFLQGCLRYLWGRTIESFLVRDNKTPRSTSPIY